MRRCDFCSKQAIYDGKTTYGPHAYMCQEHLNTVGIKTEGLYTVLAEATEATCRLCKQVKPIEEFYRHTGKDQIQRTRTECKTCNLEEKKRTAIYRSRHYG